MLKLLIPLVTVLAIAASGFYLYQNSLAPNSPSSTSSPATNASPSPQPAEKSDPCGVLVKGNIDVPPLYKENVAWGDAVNDSREVTEYEDISLGKGFSSKQVNGCSIKATTTLNTAEEIRKFYMNELQNKNWKLVDVADGPSSFYMSYKNGLKYFSLKLINEGLELFYGS